MPDDKVAANPNGDQQYAVCPIEANGSTCLRATRTRRRTLIRCASRMRALLLLRLTHGPGSCISGLVGEAIDDGEDDEEGEEGDDIVLDHHFVDQTEYEHKHQDMAERFKHALSHRAHQLHVPSLAHGLHLPSRRHRHEPIDTPTRRPRR